MEKIFFFHQNVGFRIRDLREKRGQRARKAPTREAPLLCSDGEGSAAGAGGRDTAAWWAGLDGL